MILMRHTRPVLDRRYCYGSLDIDVAESFEDDVRIALEPLPAIDRIVTSPLRRARLLAERVAHERQLSVQTDPDVREMD
ncbi:MAG: histidine phosphatase family protein, partial [Pseudomonadota bacterium]